MCNCNGIGHFVRNNSSKFLCLLSKKWQWNIVYHACRICYFRMGNNICPHFMWTVRHDSVCGLFVHSKCDWNECEWIGFAGLAAASFCSAFSDELHWYITLVLCARLVSMLQSELSTPVVCTLCFDEDSSGLKIHLLFRLIILSAWPYWWKRGVSRAWTLIWFHNFDVNLFTFWSMLL